MTTFPSDDSGDSTRLIVCEKSGDSANRLRRNLPDDGKWIVETRSLSQLVESVRQHPTSLVLLELTLRKLEHAFESIDELRRQYPQCVVTTILPAPGAEAFNAQDDLLWLLREVGVQEVIYAPGDLSALSRLWSRQCQLHTPREQTLTEQLYQKLPWAAC